jgi:integrase
VELVDGSLVTGPPKSLASRRIVSIPAFLLGDVESLVFTGPKGAPLRRGNFTRAWRKATTSAALASIHFHDPRHTGNTMAAEAGASLRELMDRMGHSSVPHLSTSTAARNETR